MCTLVMNSGGTWSRGTNLHLPFDVNVMFDLSIKSDEN